MSEPVDAGAAAVERQAVATPDAGGVWDELLERLAGVRWRSCDDCGRMTRDYVSARGALCDACALVRAHGTNS